MIINRFTTKKLALLCVIFFATFTSVVAQGLTAVNDTVRTGPLQKVTKNIINNDIIPGDSYEWQIISSSLPDPSLGVFTQNGDNIVFVPNITCRNTEFTIQYELIGSGTKDVADIKFYVSNYNNPVNVIYPDMKCVDEMPTGVSFTPYLKYVGKKSGNSSYAEDDRLDGFSMPLVGDLNGDHKPEIVAMGMSNGDGWSGTGDKIIILNGQTGAEIYRYALSNLTGSYNLRHGPRHNSVSKLAIADLNRNGIGDIIVASTGSGGQLHCIEPVYSGTTIVGMTKKWTGWTGNTSNAANFKSPESGDYGTYGSPLPYIADLNADGTPEVIVYNKIYNGVTGELVCTLQTLNDFDYPSQGTSTSDQSTRQNIISNYAYVGRRPGSSWSDDHVPCMVIADINGDNILDIIAGSKVYIMKDNAGKPALNYIINGPSSVTAQRGTGSSTTTTYVTDGFTAVADIDLDGRLDVIVLSPAESDLNNTAEQVLYVWDPLNSPTTPKAATYLYTNSVGGGTMSHPFVGDINGRLDDYTGTKRLPEICFNGGRFYTSNNGCSSIAFHPQSATALSSTEANNGFNSDNSSSIRGHIIGFTYHAASNGSTPMHQRLKLSWAMEHGDESSCTGITMFDFDNDNIKELCYRDESSVRVISPARKIYIPNTETASQTGAIRFKYTNIGSYTGFEAPVIADVNMDGSADIVTLVHSTPGGNYSKGFVHVFEHAPNTEMWAPCPPVWNQGIYFPLQINEDLTVPAKTQSMLTSYEDVNGNTIYPYNGQWIQQPVVKLGEKYIPQVRKLDAVLLDMKVTVTSNSSTSITLTIRNEGSASINAQTPIAFYNGGTSANPTTIGSGATLIGAAQPVGADIFPDEKVTRTYNISGNFNDRLIWARIVDNGTAFPASGYLECDLSNNTFSGADCPYLIYTTTASPDTVLCGNTDNVLLTATPNEPPHHTPTYQWYRNDEPIPDANGQTYLVTHTGTYKCYVIEGICRDFSSPKTITRDEPVAVDDHATASSGVQIKINVLLNDNKSEYCNPLPVIVAGKGPKKGTASVDAEGKIIYASDATYTGNDSLYYKIDDSEAKVRIHVTNKPDNVIDANCFATPPATEWSIRETVINKSVTVHNFGPLTVGDIDDDDTVEIIGFIPSSSGYQHDYESTGVRIFYFDKEEQTVKFKKDIVFKDHAATFGDMAIARYENKGYIVVSGIKKVGSGHHLYAYDAETGNDIWESSDSYFSLSGHFGSIVSIADFDGNGEPEVYTGNSIFSLKNGTRLCYGGDKGNRGQLLKYSGSMSFAANIVGDNKLELCAGDTIYSVDILSHTMTPIHSLSSQLPANAHHDGATMAADINNDGQIDVIVVSKVPTTSGEGQNNRTVVYVWTPTAGGGGDLIGHFEVPASSEYYGIPMIGNIDDTPEPEIVFVGTSSHIYALKYDGTKPAGQQIVEKWNFSINDASSCTGMSLFDFNFDGKNEIVYRDPNHLRIIDGNYSATTTLPASQVKATFDNVLSGTLREFPVVADIDDDGQAEIVVTGHDVTHDAQNGYVRVFKSGGSPWAPARKVWNQYAYNAVNIHENLTVPATQFDITSVFPGPDENNPADDIRPFNAFMQQQTYISEKGTPIMLTPDVFFTETPTFYHDVNGDSLLIRVNVKNTGEADLQAPFYISTYKNENGTNMSVDSSLTVLETGKTQHITLTIRNFSSHLPLNKITVVANNKNSAVNDFEQTECNYDNNDTAFIYSADLLLAHNDTASTVTVTPITIDILANDTIPDNCTSPTITASAKSGATVTVMGDKTIQYAAATSFIGLDTITYSIECAEKVSIAKVFILVYNKPDNIVEQESCYEPTEPFEFKIKQQWSNDRAGNQNTGVLVGDLDGDGLPEIIAYTSSTGYANIPSITIYDGQDGTPKDTVFLSSSANGTGGWHPVMTAALVDADGNGFGELIFTNPNGTVKSYKAETTGGKFNMALNWESATLFDNPTTSDYLPQPVIADFNGDGVPEVLVYNKIYNANTGQYLGYTESSVTTAYVGRIAGRSGNQCTNFITTADFDGDGMPEIVAGGKVYKVNFNADKTAVTCSIWAQHSSVVDGYTAVADVDMDGNLDVIVVNGSTRIQIWTPASKNKFDDITVFSSVYQGYPFVGDIDGAVDPLTGKKYPEICVTTINRVSAFKYNSSTGQFVAKWALSTSDGSGATGITLFDFNNDGINEIVYRDQSLLRVLNGVADNTSPVLADAGASISCISGTAFEYPVIADTDGDGSANICVTCAVSYGGVPNYLRVYESGSAPWAPTRKVWNQVNYEPLQINEDLTVPRFPLPKNTAFAGKYPYNGALIQVPTMVNEEFSIVQLASDPAVDAVWVEEVDAANLKICVRIENRGVKNTNPTLPVALYKGTITLETPAGGADYVESKPVGVVIPPGEKYTLCFEISNANLSPQMSVRIQDDGVKFVADGSYLDCDTTNNIGTGGSLLAIRDYVVTTNKPTTFKPLDNDYFGACTKATLTAFGAVANSGLKHGSLTINPADSSFTYTPTLSNFLGVDSLTYYIKCGADSSAAKVYILVQRPLSQKYAACEGASVTMGFAPITGVQYYWYNAETGGIPVDSPSNDLTVIKNDLSVETWWVAAQTGNITFPRYRVELELGDCGITDPQGCAKDGTVLFKEDFGGNATSDPMYKPEGIDNKMSGYTYDIQPTTTAYNYNKAPYLDAKEYMIAKKGEPHHNIYPSGTWEEIADHTYPDTYDRGYFLEVNAAEEKGQFYAHQIDGLCEGFTLYFSAWINNVLKSSSYEHDVNQIFILEDLEGNIIAQYYTGDIENGDVGWKQYGFRFTVPDNMSSIILRIINNGKGSSGNDFALDDIEIRLCTPPITMSIADTVVCTGTLDIVNTYIEDCTFGDELSYRFEFRHIDSDVWETLQDGTEEVDCDSPNVTDRTMEITHSIQSVNSSHEGYYRMIVSSPTHIGNVNCRAMSDSVYVQVTGTSKFPDIRIDLCPLPDRTIHLSSFLDSLAYNTISWTKLQIGAPDINNPSTGAVNTAGMTGTFKYGYSMTSKCGVSSAIAYIHPLKNKFQRYIDTITVCKAEERSRNININSILGFDVNGGTWTYNSPVNPDNTVASNVKTYPPTSSYYGALIFDAYQAWQDATHTDYSINYHGDATAKKFVFHYTATGSCLGDVNKEIVIVVTEF